MEAPLFPAGEYVPPTELSSESRSRLLEQLEGAPKRARQVVDGLTEDQLDTRYRNWTIRQIIHHLADSHINCYVRFKWALTEDTPHIKSYDESLWSEVIDARTLPLESSLQLLTGLHARWSQMIRRLADHEMERGFFHPELERVVTLNDALPSYVWHSDHHLSQIDWLRQKHGWT